MKIDPLSLSTAEERVCFALVEYIRLEEKRTLTHALINLYALLNSCNQELVWRCHSWAILLKEFQSPKLPGTGEKIEVCLLIKLPGQAFHEGYNSFWMSYQQAYNYLKLFPQ